MAIRARRRFLPRAENCPHYRWCQCPRRGSSEYCRLAPENIRCYRGGDGDPKGRCLLSTPESTAVLGNRVIMIGDDAAPGDHDQETVPSRSTPRSPEIDPASLHPLYARSVCIRCANHRTIVSGTGSVFMLCQSNAVSSGWPKYPPQPLSRCPHFESLSTAERPKSG